MLENTSICVIRLKNVLWASWDAYPDDNCLSVSPVWQVQELQSQLDQSKRSVTDLKRHCRRLTSDLQDARVLTDSLQGRAHELDRKQRRSVAFACNTLIFSATFSGCLNMHSQTLFLACVWVRVCVCVCRFDSELTQALEQADNEREQKERAIQENTVLGGEIFTLHKTLKVRAEVKGQASTICTGACVLWVPSVCKPHEFPEIPNEQRRKVLLWVHQIMLTLWRSAPESLVSWLVASLTYQAMAFAHEGTSRISR